MRRRRRSGERDTTPAILFLSRAATVFVTMTTQADDLIAVAFECCSLKEPVTQDRGRQAPHKRGLTVCYVDKKIIRHRCREIEFLQQFVYYKGTITLTRRRKMAGCPYSGKKFFVKYPQDDLNSCYIPKKIPLTPNVRQLELEQLVSD